MRDDEHGVLFLLGAIGPEIPSEQKFFEMAERFRASDEQTEIQRLGEELGELAFRQFAL